MSSQGRAGKSLTEDWSFAASKEAAEAGAAGEVLTGEVLDRLARARGFHVIHDLQIPGARTKANVDHIVISGRKVWVIDSKMWKPGFYFTLAGRTRRYARGAGIELVAHADKRGLPFAHAKIADYIGGLRPQMQNPLMVIHPSRRGQKLTLWAYRPASDPDARVRALTAGSLRFPSKPGDPRIVAALSSLVK